MSEWSVLLCVDDRPSGGDNLSVGAISQCKPQMHAVVWLPREPFDRAWTLAGAGQLRYCWLAFTEPQRGGARIVSASFTNESEEE